MSEPQEIIEPKEDEPPKITETKLFTLEILKLIKDSQQQHGLRHGDYQRYRGYCSRRLRRLRKVMKIPQADRRHFKRKDVTEAHLDLPHADERFLHIPLVLAERAWAYAMQLRQEANSEIRKKFHLIQKLRKACGYAIQLETLCNTDKCDARTKLEVQAYTAWMHGTLQFELQLWTEATENLKKAQVVYEKLASTLPDDEQTPYKQRIDEISPSLRYCAYNIGDDKAVNLLELRNCGLLENLDTLTLQAKEKRAEEIMEIMWQDLKVIVRPEKCKLFLMSIKNLDETLEKAETTQTRITMIEEMLIDCRDAVAIAREEVRANAVGSQLLLTYLLYIRLTRTIQRNEYLVEQARKPQDSVRLYDLILQQMTELKELAGLEENKKYQDDVANKINMYRAYRCFYVGKTFIAARKWREALALYKSGLQYIQNIVDSEAADLKDRVTQLRQDIQYEACVARAQCVIEDTEENEAADKNSDKNNPKEKLPLIDRLDEYSDETLLTKNPNIVPLPPPIEPAPYKPIFYDLAGNFVKFPDIKSNVETQQNKPKTSAGMSGFVKGLFGWGGK